jgi:DNA (cytosine-5)-methyltransferase 1
MLTSEGGTTASRTNHLILDPRTGQHRILTPVECERLNGFPQGWTEGMPERWRYFCMGNALVVGLVQRMGQRISLLPDRKTTPVERVAIAKQ